MIWFINQMGLQWTDFTYASNFSVMKIQSWTWVSHYGIRGEKEFNSTLKLGFPSITGGAASVFFRGGEIREGMQLTCAVE